MLSGGGVCGSVPGLPVGVQAQLNGDCPQLQGLRWLPSAEGAPRPLIGAGRDLRWGQVAERDVEEREDSVCGQSEFLGHASGVISQSIRSAPGRGLGTPEQRFLPFPLQHGRQRGLRRAFTSPRDLPSQRVWRQEVGGLRGLVHSHGC